MANTRIAVRVAKIALFSVAFGFVGFAACMPAHRNYPRYGPALRICPQDARIVNDHCICRDGKHRDDNSCEAALPVEPSPQTH